MEKELILLENVLQKENEVVEKLFNASKKQLEALKENKAQELSTIVEEQSKLSNILKSLEKERKEIQIILSKKYRISENITLSSLIESNIFDNEDIIFIGKKLKNNFSELKEINETNNLLVRQSLAYINKIASLSGFRQKKSRTYGANGNISTKMNQIKIDKSI